MIDNTAPASNQAIFEIAAEHACAQVPIVTSDRRVAEARQSLLEAVRQRNPYRDSLVIRVARIFLIYIRIV